MGFGLKLRFLGRLAAGQAARLRFLPSCPRRTPCSASVRLWFRQQVAYTRSSRGAGSQPARALFPAPARSRNVFLQLQVLLHPGRLVLYRPRRHDGANVFAHSRDRAHSSGPVEEASHVAGWTIWPCCTRAHTTARRACLGALTRGRACCPHVPTRPRTYPQSHAASDHQRGLVRVSDALRRRGPPTSQYRGLPSSPSTCGQSMRAALCAAVAPSRMSGATRRRDPYPLLPPIPLRFDPHVWDVRSRLAALGPPSSAGSVIGSH